MYFRNVNIDECQNFKYNSYTQFFFSDTAIGYSNSTFSAKIPDHLAVGSFVLVLEVTGVDYTEEVNFTAMQHPSFTDSLQYFAVDAIGTYLLNNGSNLR
jgi:hypothetical protein